MIRHTFLVFKKRMCLNFKEGPNDSTYPLAVVGGVLPVAVLLDGEQGKAVIGGLAASHLGNDKPI